ncbi:MAG: T9SS type A sorting domain-containing protein [candidate division WOR-3 bacterium]|nr:T9SS type A sorting domain-containing protein [candidate division WOR-3 bacterium]
MKKVFIELLYFSFLFSQVFDSLYLPDSLGGCADLNAFIFNPIMNRIYIWSDRSDNMGVLDCAGGERLKPIHSIPSDANQHTSCNFVYNPNNNNLYTSSYRDGRSDSLVYVIDCSTQVIIDTIIVDLDSANFSIGGINIPANKIFLTIGDYTYLIDAATNQVIGRLETSGDFVHHQNRKIAYNYYFRLEKPIYVIDADNDTISDSIVPPPTFRYYNLLLSSETERLFAVAFSYQFPYNLLHIIDCVSNQIIGELQLPVSSSDIRSLSYNSANNKLYVTAGKIYIIDLNSIQIVDSLNLSAQLIYNVNTNHLYALTWLLSSVPVIDGETNQIIDEIPLPYPPYYGFLHPTFNKLYLTDWANIFIVDCNQRRLERYFKVAYLNQYMMWQPVTNRLYINDVCGDTFSSILTVYDANTHFPIKVLDLSDFVPSGEWFYHFTTATQVNKIYLTSAQSRGIYVLDGNTDSLINFISCDVGGHYLLYNPNQNKLYTFPFTEFTSGYIYIIDCENDMIRNVIDVIESGNGYFNPYNDKVYATISYEYWPAEFKVFVIDGVGDTVIKVLDSLGLPLAFRNKENIHQVYIGSVFRDRIYVFDSNNDSLIDSVMNVPVRAFDDQFFYFDSTDDRIYYPQDYGVLVIDCSINRVMDTIFFPSYSGLATFPEENIWNPVSNRFYTHGFHPWYYPVYIIDCRANTIIDSCSSLLLPTIMQWNSINNVVYVMDHLRSKILAIRDDLICIEEIKSVSSNNELLVYPTIGYKFIVKRKIDTEMQIYDVCGRIVKRIGKGETIIDSKNLTHGVYFIRLDEKKTKSIQKVIVVK